MDTKYCCRCGEDKPRDAKYFHRGRTRPDGLQPYCKVCQNALNLEYARTHREQAREIAKEWRDKNKSNVIGLILRKDWTELFKPRRKKRNEAIQHDLR